LRLFTNLLIIFDEHFSSGTSISLDGLNYVANSLVKLALSVEVWEAHSYHLFFLHFRVFCRSSGSRGRGAAFLRGLYFQNQLQLGAVSHLLD